MERRAFIGVLTGSLLAAPLAAEAQQAGRVPRIGMLWLASRPDVQHFIQAYESALRQLGYAVNQSVLVEERFANGDAQQLSVMAAQLVSLNVDLIAVGPNPMIEAARGATSRIPIVMAYGDHPMMCQVAVATMAMRFAS